MRNICRPLPEEFWNHVYNISGGPSCRVTAWEMYRELYGVLGLRDPALAMDANWSATRNFHGQYYLDADRLEEVLGFRNDSMGYLYDTFRDQLGGLVPVTRALCRLPFGERLLGSSLRSRLRRVARRERGTVRFIEAGMEEAIAAYWGSRDGWEAILPLAEWQPFDDWDAVVPIGHGYDESKPEAELTLADVHGAAEFRGGSCLSEEMATGDWRTPLRFRCAFDHEFDASPRLVMEGGHWCDSCERTSWNYYERAERDPFFAQVCHPLHPADEPAVSYPKEVHELGVRFGPEG